MDITNFGNQFRIGQYCFFTIKSKDVSPVEVIGQIIDTDHDGERCFVYYDGMYFVRWTNELQHLYGDRGSKHNENL